MAAICEKHGWELQDLAEAAGYSLRTLQKAQNPRSGVILTDKMRDALSRASMIRQSYQNEDPATYRRVSMKPQTTPPDEAVELMQDLLEQYRKTNSGFKKGWLADQICNLAEGLRPPPEKK